MRVSFFAIIAVLAFPLLLHADTLAGKRPNIIFILTDDQGYGDLSATGNPVLKTPNIDKFYNESVRFSDFHVSPTCAPTRSALITGRHEFRNGVTHTINERERLTLDAVTLPQVLKGAGYTTGIFGKWHLGDEPDHWPSARGFDESFTHGAGGIGQAYPGSCGDAPGNTYFSPYILHNGKFEKTDGYCTDVFFRQATNWIDQCRQKKQPFLCWLATNVPHAPLQVKKEDEALYAGKVGPQPAKFFGMLHNLDQNVGKLHAKLIEWGMDRDTLVILMNDNGGTAGVPVYNAGMHGQKGTPWLGGTRAFSIWHWPAMLKPADVKALASNQDFFPTIAELAGAKLDEKTQKQVEGRSLVPLLSDPNAAWPDRMLVTHVGRWAAGKAADSKYLRCSVRSTRWHLVSDDKKGEKKWELYDVHADPGEKTNVIADHPDVVKEMDAFYDKWWRETQPMLVNENVPLAKENPFKELFAKQIGGTDKK